MIEGRFTVVTASGPTYSGDILGCRAYAFSMGPNEMGELCFAANYFDPGCTLHHGDMIESKGAYRCGGPRVDFSTWSADEIAFVTRTPETDDEDSNYLRDAYENRRLRLDGPNWREEDEARRKREAFDKKFTQAGGWQLFGQERRDLQARLKKEQAS